MVYLVAQMVKNPSAYAEDPGLIPGWEYPRRRKWKHSRILAWRIPCTGDLLLLLLSRFSRVPLCATPKMAAHPAPPSLGFSRQEH